MLLFKSKREKILAREFRGADAVIRQMDPLVRFGIVCRMRDYVTAGNGLAHFFSLDVEEQEAYILDFNERYKQIKLRGEKTEIIPIALYLMLLESISMEYTDTEKMCRSFMNRGLADA